MRATYNINDHISIARMVSETLQRSPTVRRSSERKPNRKCWKYVLILKILCYGWLFQEEISQHCYPPVYFNKRNRFYVTLTQYENDIYYNDDTGLKMLDMPQ